MKALIILLTAFLISTSFAGHGFYTTGFSQHTSQLANIWKNHQHPSPTFNKNDITMGYGGADVARKLPTDTLVEVA